MVASIVQDWLKYVDLVYVHSLISKGEKEAIKSIIQRFSSDVISAATLKRYEKELKFLLYGMDVRSKVHVDCSDLILLECFKLSPFFYDISSLNLNIIGSAAEMRT